VAQDYVDESNPFSRSGDEVELRREYGSGGRKISTEPMKSPGVSEGTVVEPKIGKPGDGATLGFD
jgi:hypothetical protein